MSKIEDKCKDKGVRLTDQRRLIAKVMSDSKQTYGSKDHPDVDELHKRVNELDKNISIATVYRTVKLFEEAGGYDNKPKIQDISSIINKHQFVSCSFNCTLLVLVSWLRSLVSSFIFASALDSSA